MTCGCGRSPDSCRGWHSLSQAEYEQEYARYLRLEVGKVSVTGVEHYTDALFKFATERPPGFEFRAGEFVMLGLEGTPQRAYSIASNPHADDLEFYSIKAQEGELTSRLQHIKPGDSVRVSPASSGTLVLDNLEQGTDLWLLATGTGIAPFASIVRDPQTWQQYERVHVAWSVRTEQELAAYRHLFEDTPVDFHPTVTQDPDWQGASERISALLHKKQFELDSKTDRVMLCGNLNFNRELQSQLEQRGFRQGTKKRKGTFLTEQAFVDRA